MPIGASKVGALGGLVPGGSVTFNASGNWDVPPGVKIVSIEGKGSTGNPGNAGNPGNSGTPGSGGGGGGGGKSEKPCGGNNNGRPGGAAGRPGMISRGSITLCPATIPGNKDPWWQAGTAPPTWINQFTVGGFSSPLPASQNNGQSGQTGGSGQAGQAGQSGNPGQSSSGLGNTFPGGAGGNAGNAGAAGTGGSGGSGGGTAGNANPSAAGNPGSGGNGGGNGGAGGTFSVPDGGPRGNVGQAANGGGGAGATNSGQSGQPACVNPNPINPRFGAIGGEDAQVSAPITQPGGPNTINATNTMGGGGGGPSTTFGLFAIRFGAFPTSNPNPCGYTPLNPSRVNLPQFSPTPLAPNIIRAGGGGGSGGGEPNLLNWRAAGGGGGGGRGNAGNSGGAGGAGGTGAAANPTTFNCVAVTPGATVPITVASPGGQIVISWNPQ